MATEIRQIQMRRDTAANWTSANPTLASGEFGFETDTKQLKIGDGSAAWTSLPYLQGSASLTVPCSDRTTPIVAATNVMSFRVYGAHVILAVRASLVTAAATGTFTIDINRTGADGSILTTKLTIDATEKTSATAATPAVIDPAKTDGPDDAEYTIDVDDDASGDATGLQVTLVITAA